MTARKFIVIFLCILLLVTVAVQPTRVQGAINLTRIVNVIRRVAGYIEKIRKAGHFLGYIPHSFPFGGHITSSERACSFKFWIWTYICYGPLGCYQTPCPNCGFIPLGGRAIKVGPPLASPGKIIIFPWISDVYRNHSEKRVGPWALGLGFTPFPLAEINDALGLIEIPPGPPCGSRIGPPYVPNCFDHFHISCQASGEKDRTGGDIYKVIRKLGTGP